MFAKRKEFDRLFELLDHVCFREFPNLGAIDDSPNETNADKAAQKYIQLFRQIGKKTSFLVTEWLRIGYTQGNMNSDNILVGGRTIDYGPYGNHFFPILFVIV